jgi:endonuclease/exonuclease/phosphatase family metal-dependent hydrolase
MSKKIKIISFNICAIPWWGNIFGDPLNRIDKIIEFLEKKNPDIICLQEVFDKNIFFIIKTRLFKYNFYKPTTKTNILDSGLLILSKTKITKNHFGKFTNSCGEDRYCDKGFMYITTQILGKKFTIINTHLNADAIFSTYRTCEEIRIKQIDQIIKKFNNKLENDTIFCGDFNIDFTTVTGKQIYNKIKNLSCVCIKSKNMITFDDENIQFDQIFYIPKIKCDYKCKYRVFDSNCKELSDHYPIQLLLTRY